MSNQSGKPFSKRVSTERTNYRDELVQTTLTQGYTDSKIFCPIVGGRVSMEEAKWFNHQKWKRDGNHVTPNGKCFVTQHTRRICTESVRTTEIVGIEDVEEDTEAISQKWKSCVQFRGR